MRSSAIQPLPTPSSIASCITLIGSPSRARACAKPPPSVRSLTTSPPTDLMTTSSREPASAGGRDHRNPWPASIGTGGRLRSESTADFVGMRKLGERLAKAFEESAGKTASMFYDLVQRGNVTPAELSGLAPLAPSEIGFTS